MFPPPFQPNSASGLWYFVFAINLICLTISQSQGTLCSRRKKCYQMYRQSFSTRAYTRSNLKITALRLDPRTYLLNWNGILEGLRWFVFSQKSQLLFAFSVTKIFFFFDRDMQIANYISFFCICRDCRYLETVLIWFIISFLQQVLIRYPQRIPLRPKTQQYL